ncbi:MAG: glycosidase, partial [Clostridiales bacterium]|nr:glycosidase [Clostridiales bacterium]
MKYEIYSEEISNIPWEEKPAGCIAPVWRSKLNPIIKRDILPNGNSVFNSAAVPFNGAFAGVFRVDDKARALRLHRGFSNDGIHWEIDPTP